jgi:hypothetical protein
VFRDLSGGDGRAYSSSWWSKKWPEIGQKQGLTATGQMLNYLRNAKEHRTSSRSGGRRRYRRRWRLSLLS